jgi:hypothetical protein
MKAMNCFLSISYGFRSIPVQSGKHRLSVHTAKSVLLLLPLVGLNPQTTRDLIGVRINHLPVRSRSYSIDGRLHAVASFEFKGGLIGPHLVADGEPDWQQASHRDRRAVPVELS